jgi:hypothetical protein
VATYETILTVPRPVEATFAFVSDFCNAVHWDPRTYATEKATDGPIGVGTRFLLTGGMLHGDVVRRLHLPLRVAGMRLPYDITEFDPPNQFVLVGETRLFRYRDHLEFSADGDGTRLRYVAELDGKGPMGLGKAMLQRMFDRIGDDATRDIAAVVAERT